MNFFALPSTQAITFSASVAAHALLVVSMLFVPHLKSPLPLGVNRKGDATLIELGSTTSTKKSTPTVSRNPDDIVVKTKMTSKTKSPEERDQKVAKASDSKQEAQFGSPDGTTESGPLGVQNGSVVSERERYLYELRRLIDGRKIYPSMAKRMRQSGEVVVKFVILKSGEIQNIEIAKPSHHDRLNEAASQLVAGIRTYKPLPASVASATSSLVVSVPVEYRLQ